jgi:hypothetical protein
MQRHNGVFTYLNWFYTHKTLYYTLGCLMYEIDAAQARDHVSLYFVMEISILTHLHQTKLRIN